MQLRVPPARGDPRHQRRARAVPRSSSASGDPKAHAMKRHLWDVSETVLPHRHVFDFNQALMDFGATLCTRAQAEVPGLPDAEPAARRIRSIRTTNSHDDRRRRGDRRGRRPLSRDAAAEGRAPRRPLGISRRQVRAGRIARGRPAARAARRARRRRRGRRRDLHRDARLRRPQRRAALLLVRVPRRAGAAARSGDALGARATSWRRWSSRRPTTS